jgi:hypothetical protein
MPSRLQLGEELGLNETLASENGWYVLRLEPSGLLVLYVRPQVERDGPPWRALWTSEPKRTGGRRLVLRERDGLFLADASQRISWRAYMPPMRTPNSGSANRRETPDPPARPMSLRGSYLDMQDDGNCVLYLPRPGKGPKALWSTKTDIVPRFKTRLDAMGHHSIEACEKCAAAIRRAAVEWGIGGALAGGGPGGLGGMTLGGAIAMALDSECQSCIKAQIESKVHELKERGEWDHVNDTIRDSMAGEGRREMDRTMHEMDRAERASRTA